MKDLSMKLWDISSGEGGILRNLNDKLYIYYKKQWYEVNVLRNIRRINGDPKGYEVLLRNQFHYHRRGHYFNYEGTRIFGFEIPEIQFKYLWVIGNEILTDEEMERMIIKANMLNGFKITRLTDSEYQKRLRDIGRDLRGNDFRTAIKYD